MPENLNMLLVLDVDGVLTDGGVISHGADDSPRVFHVQDGLAIKLWRSLGGRVAVLSGRRSEAVARRARELDIEWVRMGLGDKSSAFDELFAESGVPRDRVVVVGDDFPDLSIMRRCGLSVAVANARADVKRGADYVTRRAGGTGAVAEIVEFLLRREGLWSRAIANTV